MSSLQAWPFPEQSFAQKMHLLVLRNTLKTWKVLPKKYKGLLYRDNLEAINSLVYMGVRPSEFVLSDKKIVQIFCLSTRSGKKAIFSPNIATVHFNKRKVFVCLAMWIRISWDNIIICKNIKHYATLCVSS